MGMGSMLKIKIVDDSAEAVELINDLIENEESTGSVFYNIETNDGPKSGEATSLFGYEDRITVVTDHGPGYTQPITGDVDWSHDNYIEHTFSTGVTRRYNLVQA